jgi:serine/threonine-protein kinase
MKLIQGRTLAQLLKERQDPGEDLPRFLAIFEQVCQTLAYAHSKGVIHRDLKPSNVMVGAFGEVQVMDWGLAKVLPPSGGAEAPAGDAGAIATTRAAEPGGWSQAGAVLGTYAYMAPEQALGQAAQLDRRCDVFGLGAILCEVLTGRPPYAAAGREAHLQAAEAELADAWSRLDGCGADADLLALCRRCLSPNPKDRPANGQAVADGLTAYLTGVQERLQAVERERAVAAAREAEQRKRRRVQFTLAAAALLVLVAGVVVSAYFAVDANYQAELAKSQAKRAEAAAAGEATQKRIAERKAEEARPGSPAWSGR